MSAGQLPYQPTVDRPERQPPGTGAQPADGVEQPAQLGSGKVGIDDQPGFPPHHLFEPVGFETIAQTGRASVLPNDGAVHRSTAPTIPEYRRLTLIRNPYGDKIGRFELRSAQRHLDDSHAHPPDLFRVVLNPTRLWVVLREFRVAPPTNGPSVVEYDRRRASSTLINGQNITAHSFSSA